tara:strand:- start:589 stop:795 length:207 start_codon:yes stop_codon:yes gene_type:complete
MDKDKELEEAEILEHELEGIETDLANTLPFRRGQAHVWGDSQDKWDTWQKELETRRAEILAKLKGETQ